MTLEPMRDRIGHPARRNERGASAIVVALLMTVIMAAGALGLDISKLVFERQQVRAAVDAAAQIGAAQLSPAALGTVKATNLEALIQKAAVANYGSSTYGAGLKGGKATDGGNVTVDFYCVVANTSGSSVVAPNKDQIPDTCDPDPTKTDYTAGTKCDATSCAIPCYPMAVEAAVCNAVRVSASKEVQYVLAPAIGIKNPTAKASTISCQGSCGGDAGPNPLNVVVMADRTPSMFNEDAPKKNRDKDLVALRSGMVSMLKIMNTDQQYLAFGAIQKSVPKGGDLTSPPSKTDYTFTNTTEKCNDRGCSYSHTGNTFKGTWVPVKFSNDYIYRDALDVPQWNTTSDVYQSMFDLAYSNMTSDGTTRYSYSQADGKSGNTHLAAALKGAASYLLDKDHNNIATLDAATKRPSIYGVAKDVIIFETDGSPAEIFTNDSDAVLKLNNPDDIGNPDGEEACTNFKQVADYAKAKDITIITIGFGAASDSDTLCKDRWGSTPVQEVLAAVASPIKGTPASANNDCTDTSTNGGVFKENNDGDNYFCAATGDQLKKVFEAALGNVTGGTKFMAIDGVGD